MRVVVTGCAGFIGAHLSARLLARGDTVAGLDCFDETLYPAARHRAQLAPLLAHPGFTFAEADILDTERIVSCFAGAGAVVHLAGLAGVRPSLTQARRYLRVNAEGTQSVLDAMTAAGVGRLLLASSSSVYGEGARAAACAETDPLPVPASPYAASKRAAELVCETHAARADVADVAICALRFFTVYGPSPRPDMAIARFIGALRRGEPLTLYGDGSSARDYTYVDDIVDGVLAALAHTAVLRAQPEAARFRVYNLGGAAVTPLAALVRMLEEALGRTARLERLPAQPGDVLRTHADLRRARAELGYAPAVPLAEGLRRTCAAPDPP